MQWSINESQVHVVLPEGYVSSDGRFCGTKQSGCPVPIQLAFLPAQAEPFRLILMNKGGKTRIAAVVPDPIIATDQGMQPGSSEGHGEIRSRRPSRARI